MRVAHVAGVCGVAAFVSCVYTPRPQIAIPKPTPAIEDPTVLPFEQALDATLQRERPELFTRLQAMDQRGDRDGTFRRGDAAASGIPQLFGDFHAHPFMHFGAGPLLRGLPSDAKTAGSPSEVLTTQVTFEGLRRSAVNLVFAFAYAPEVWSECAKGREGKLGEILCQIHKTRAFCRRHSSQIAIATTADEAREIVGSGRIAVVLGVEGGDSIQEISEVDRLYRAGVRVVTLVHFVNSPLAGAASSSLWHYEDPNFLTAGENTPEGYPRNPMGMTPFGAQVVRRMAALGMVIDLNHASDTVVRDVLEMTKDVEAPVVFSHTAMRVLHPSELNVADDTIRAVASRGGVIGLIDFKGQLTMEGLDECHAFGAHFRHLLEVAGPEHVAVGTDFNGFIPRPGPCAGGGKGIDGTGFRNIGDFGALLQGLADEGIPPKVLEGMGENMLRVLTLAQGRASARRR